MTHRHHSIDYVEFTSPDPTVTGEFFSAAFGWGTTSYGPEYTGLRDGRPDDEEAGGIASGDPVPPLVIVYSDDLTATEAAVRAAGGEITVEPYDFPGGRRFHFREPGGTTMAVWAHAQS